MTSNGFHEINCSECDAKAYPAKIDYEPDKGLYKVVIKCPNHKIKMEISEDEIDEYLTPFFESTLSCPICNAVFPEYFELESYLKWTSRFKPTYLLLKMGCENCQSKIVYEWSNRLYVKYYDFLFEYLRKFVNADIIRLYQGFLECRKCGSGLIAQNIGLDRGYAFFKGVCTGDGHHKVGLMDMKLNHRPMWLGLLRDSINICELCHSKDITIIKRDFTVKQMFATLGLRSRWIIRLCNNCGKEKLAMMHHGHYEIYRRIVKASEGIQLDVGKLYCTKCSSEVMLNKLDVKKDNAIAHLVCEEKHKTKMDLYLGETKEWIGGLINSIDRCSKCWSTNQKGFKVSHIQAGDDLVSKKFKLELKCPNCGKKRDITLNNIVFDYVMDYFFK